MGHQLTLELPDELYEPLTNAATAVGQSLDEWILVRLRPLAQRPVLSEKEKEAAMAELMAFAGRVNSGNPNSADNERIDADMARAYGNIHEKELQMPNVEAVVDKLVKEYFDIEEGIKYIVWINPNQGKEIWLIEVDTTAIPAGRVEPFYFKPNEEVPYPVRIANITPDEWEAVKEIQVSLEERSLKPKQQFVDKGYTTGDNLADSKENDITLMGEVGELDNNGLFTADEFIIDFEAKTATCPAGCTSHSWKEFFCGKHQGEIEISLGQQCQDCPHKENCTLAKDGRKLRLHRHYQLLKARRQECKTDAFKQAMKRRPPVEGTISEMVRAHGLRKTRYRGLAKTHLQNLIKGAALNLKRLIKRISLPKNGQKQQLATA